MRKFAALRLKSQPQKVSLNRPQIRLQSQQFDKLLLFVVFILSLFGLLMVYDSSQVEAFNDFGNKYHFFKQQVVWMILGYLGLGFFSIVNYHQLKKIALPFFLLSVIL